MASAKQRKAAFISYKLKFLTDQGDHLISAVGDYVNRIIVAGESWTQGGTNTMEYQKLSQMIDTAVEFLCEKCDELTDLTSRSITCMAIIPATSDRQPATSLASTATTSYRQSTGSVQPADGAHMKPVLDRIAVIEEVFSFRSRTEKVSEQQCGIDEQLKEMFTKQSELDKKHSSWFKQVKQQISDISETRDAIEQEQKTRLQSLEKQLHKISTAQNRLKAKMESRSELVEKLAHVPNLLESMKEHADALDARICGITDEVRNKHEDSETATHNLTDAVMDNTQSVELISEGQAQNTTLLRELETRLQTLEADGGRNYKDVQKQAEKGAANLSQLIQEVAVMSPRLQQLEIKSPGTRCGFSARAWPTTRAARDTIIRQYMTPDCNVGGNFDADTGIFTAPVDGLYVAVISLFLWENEYLRVDVQYKQSLDQDSSTEVCESSEVTKQTSACGVGVVDMKAGEVLYSRVYKMEKNRHDKLVYFSCFLLG